MVIPMTLGRICSNSTRPVQREDKDRGLQFCPPLLGRRLSPSYRIRVSRDDALEVLSRRQAGPTHHLYLMPRNAWRRSAGSTDGKNENERCLHSMPSSNSRIRRNWSSIPNIPPNRQEASATIATCHRLSMGSCQHTGPMISPTHGQTKPSASANRMPAISVTWTGP